MKYDEIIIDQRDMTAWIYLSRPEAMNSLTNCMVQEIEDALNKLDKDTVRCIVISGKGKAFCAGADLKEVLAQKGKANLGSDFIDNVSIATNHLRNYPKPVIAALNGLTLAGGLEIAMCCDIVIAAASAKIGDAHSNFGVFPGAGGASILPVRIGLNRAKYLLFTGEMISAAKMKDFGLISEVVPDGDLEEFVQSLSAKLARKSPIVLSKMKQVANQSLYQSQEASLRHELLMLRDHMRSYDMQEGLLAFTEKRKPNFKGE